MNNNYLNGTCHHISLAAIAVAIGTVVNAIWTGAHGWTWQMLGSTSAVFLGFRAMMALSKTPAHPTRDFKNR